MAKVFEILLAEDERILRTQLEARLVGAGYRVWSVKNGEEAVERFRERRPDLVLLDVMMPRMDGWQACREIRKLDSTVAIMFRTVLAADVDQVRGLGLGADDYVAKTDSDEVLLARIAARLRRTRDDEQSVGFDFGEWRVDPIRMTMRSASAEVGLTLREVELLRWFKSHPGEPFSRDFLMTRFCGAGAGGDDAAVVTMMHRLRAKLGPAGKLIQVTRGIGYAFRVSRHEPAFPA